MNSTGRILTAVAITGAVTGGAAYVWNRIQRMRASIAAGKLRLNETLPIHSQWWREAEKDEGELLYVAIGDSAAQGIGASRPTNSYVGVIADHLRSATGHTVRVVNLSVSGATVALAVADQLPRFEKLRPDFVTVSIGANDIAAFDPATFRAGIRRVLAALPPHAVVADLPYFYLPRNEKKVAVANGILREEAASAGLTVAPLHQSMRREGLRGALTQFAEDLFHPNDHGYRVWASAFLPAIIGQATADFPRRLTARTDARAAAPGALSVASTPAPGAPTPSPTPAR